MKARAHVLISGTVHGVFFRAETRKKAEEVGVTGWVRNLYDGRVEVVFEGEKEKVDQMIAWCRKGPPLARVEDITVKWEPYQDQFADFFVVYRGMRIEDFTKK